MDLGIAGRRAVVTGASAGLGLESAAALAEAGVRVSVCGRDTGRLREIEHRLGDEPMLACVDLTDPRAAREYIVRSAEDMGGLDILVINVPGPPLSTFATLDTGDLRAVLDTHISATIEMCKVAVPVMQAQRWGRIVAVTSIGVRQPVPNLILSNLARSGFTAFLKTLATEVAADGITVNSVQPGYHETSRFDTFAGDDRDTLTRQVPAGCFGQAADFGGVVAFLCSEYARYMTGVALPVDGGLYAGLM